MCLFYLPLVIIWLLAPTVLWIVYQRLKNGLEETFLARIRVLAVNFTQVAIFVVWWFLYMVTNAMPYIIMVRWSGV